MNNIHPPKRQIKLSFDSASTSAEAMRHWRGADYLSADAELISDVRHRIISRARYETANSGYLHGIVQTLADDTIGTGARLQLFGGDANRKTLQKIEKRWKRFARKIRLAEKLRIARISKARDGECFIQKVSNPEIEFFDIAVFESEQVGSQVVTHINQYHKTGVPKEIDGVMYDKYGNVTAYRFFRIHPGALDTVRVIDETYTVPAKNVIHYKNVTRAGQHRGISEFAPTLVLFNDMRGYGDAVLASAKLASNLAFTLETDVMPDPEQYDLSERMTDDGKLSTQVSFTDVLPLAKNSGVVLPEGWHISQLKAEQPTGTYSSFIDAKLNEASRCISMPFNVAKGNSSSYNYSSGKLDHQIYHKKISIERKLIENVILDDIFETWTEFDSAYYPEDYAIEFDHRWMWDAFEAVDATKEAQAQSLRLQNLTTTLAEECAVDGKDWEDVLKQRAREMEIVKGYGLTEEPSAVENNDEEEENGTEEQ